MTPYRQAFAESIGAGATAALVALVVIAAVVAVTYPIYRRQRTK
jgi:hypothetical protein